MEVPRRGLDKIAQVKKRKPNKKITGRAERVLGKTGVEKCLEWKAVDRHREWTFGNVIERLKGNTDYCWKPMQNRD